MKVLYNLCISCLTEENYWAEYPIGLFKSTDDVDVIIKKIMSAGGKFSQSNCKPRISEVEVVGESVDIDCVYRFYGQNIDSSLKGEIIESPCYIDKSTAIHELMNAKKYTPRQQWYLETHMIGKCKW